MSIKVPLSIDDFKQEKNYLLKKLVRKEAELKDLRGTAGAYYRPLVEDINIEITKILKRLVEVEKKIGGN